MKLDSSEESTATLPVLQHVRDWAKLEAGDYVQAYRNGHLLACGDVDDMTPDGHTVWMVQDHGLGRVLVHTSDRVDIFQETP